MKNSMRLTSATFCLLIGAAGMVTGTALAKQAGSGRGEPSVYVSECVRARDRAAGVTTSTFKSYAEIDSHVGYVEGLPNWFCVFEDQAPHMGMIDLATLGSDRPSIAATYLLKGLDLDAMDYNVGPPYPWGAGNPAIWVCEQLRGSSIARYANGGFTSPAGEDEVCVFGDGSKISTWVLIYVSFDDPGPDYLSMRKAVQSLPLEVDLPYLGDLPDPSDF